MKSLKTRALSFSAMLKDVVTGDDAGARPTGDRLRALVCGLQLEGCRWDHSLFLFPSRMKAAASSADRVFIQERRRSTTRTT